MRACPHGLPTSDYCKRCFDAAGVRLKTREAGARIAQPGETEIHVVPTIEEWHEEKIGCPCHPRLEHKNVRTQREVWVHRTAEECG